MAKHIVIERENGCVTIVRSELETASEQPLTEHEVIINELWQKLKNSENSKQGRTFPSLAVDEVVRLNDCKESRFAHGENRKRTEVASSASTSQSENMQSPYIICCKGCGWEFRTMYSYRKLCNDCMSRIDSERA